MRLIPLHPTRSSRLLTLLFILLVIVVSMIVRPSSAITNSGNITTLDAPLTENFNTLATGGTANPWSDNSTIGGMYAQFAAVPTNPTTYIADAGTSNTGGIHAYGTGTNTERALGSVGSNTTGDIFFGFKLTNSTGNTITSLDVSYVGEQWRNGGNTTAHTLTFQYQVANAGVINLSASANVTPEDYDRHFAINARGVFFGVQAIAPLIRDGGSIIVTSSLAATKILPNHTVYAGSKAAVAAFAKNWAIEFKSRRIRVNILSPGPVETEILGKLGVSEAERPAFEDYMSQLIPAGRLGRSEELARAALFLASDAGSFVNGIELHVDGGMTLA